QGKGCRLRPQLLGGPQERDRRGGTENTPGIIGLGVAAELAETFLSDRAKIETFKGLRDRLDETMVKAMPDTVVHGRSAERLWNTTNLGFPKLEAEAILLGSVGAWGLRIGRGSLFEWFAGAFAGVAGDGHRPGSGPWLGPIFTEPIHHRNRDR
ncbi:MAG: hypothetical protein HC898_07045, partial [Phycisphaerales bacterium]|nr:hypothetical protein [Phycisphaerales bacterium]